MKHQVKDISVAATVHAHRHKIAEWWCRIVISSSEPLDCYEACEVIDFLEQLIGGKAVKDAWRIFQKGGGNTEDRIERLRKALSAK